MLFADEKTQIECDPVGTDLFMAPEALQDRPIIGFSSDIWSLGVVLFFCLVCLYSLLTFHNYTQNI